MPALWEGMALVANVTGATPPVLLLSRSRAMLRRLTLLIEAAGFATRPFGSLPELLQSGLDGRCLVLQVSGRGDRDDAAEILRRITGRLPVILIADAADVCRGARALTSGMFDVFEMPFSPPDLLHSIEAAVGGAAAPDAGGLRAMEELTEREREVLQQLIQGDSAKVIGKRLGISPRTVEVHRARIMDKLAARNLADLVRIAMQELNAMSDHAAV